MNAITATGFRKSMFSVLHGVVQGGEVIVKARGGDVLLRKVKKGNRAAGMAQKVPGKILGELGPDADAELRDYIEGQNWLQKTDGCGRT
jgi:hypothetical protein